MSDVSAIEWTDATWNPVTGCTRVSPGCASCYIERTPPFRMQGRRFAIVGQESTTGVTLHPDRLEQPLHWRKPRRVFVCSLADLFHEDVPEHFIQDVFETMARCPQHTFQVLTKRPERALEIIRTRAGEFPSFCELLSHSAGGRGSRDVLPPNIWVGVSIENARYTWRADVLREIPAAVRFISAEPLLGSLFNVRWVPAPCTCGGNALGRACRDYCNMKRNAVRPVRRRLDLTGIDWVIIGGESGPGARPFHLEHAREIIRACRDHDVAPFVKQLGAKPLGRGYVNQTEDGPPFHLQLREDVPMKLRDSKGGDIDEWPADLQIREYPQTAVAA